MKKSLFYKSKIIFIITFVNIMFYNYKDTSLDFNCQENFRKHFTFVNKKSKLLKGKVFTIYLVELEKK